MPSLKLSCIFCSSRGKIIDSRIDGSKDTTISRIIVLFEFTKVVIYDGKKFSEPQNLGMT